MIASDRVGDCVDVVFLDPNTQPLPVDRIFIGQHAIGVDENRNAAAAQRLIQPIRKISGAADAQHVVAVDDVLNELLARGLLARSAIRRAQRSIPELATDQEIAPDTARLRKAAQRLCSQYMRGAVTAKTNGRHREFFAYSQISTEVTLDEVFTPHRSGKLKVSAARTTDRRTKHKRTSRGKRLVCIAAGKNHSRLSARGRATQKPIETPAKIRPLEIP